MPTITKLYSMEETTQHNTSDDCWVVIDGKVYDVSSYMDEHPGGDDVFLRATGKDAIEEFEDAGHSKSAIEMMEQFFIGELDSPPPAIPKLEIFKKDEPNTNLLQKVLDISKQYWFVPVSVIGLSIAVGVLYQRKK